MGEWAGGAQRGVASPPVGTTRHAPRPLPTASSGRGGRGSPPPRAARIATLAIASAYAQVTHNRLCNILYSSVQGWPTAPLCGWTPCLTRAPRRGRHPRRRAAPCTQPPATSPPGSHGSRTAPRGSRRTSCRLQPGHPGLLAGRAGSAGKRSCRAAGEGASAVRLDGSARKRTSSSSTPSALQGPRIISIRCFPRPSTL